MSINQFQLFAHLFHPTYDVIGYRFLQLTEAQLHVVKVWNRLAQRLFQVYELLLELPESATAVVATLGCNLLNRLDPLFRQNGMTGTFPLAQSGRKTASHSAPTSTALSTAG